MSFPEQAIYHALTHKRQELLNELASFEYTSPQIIERAQIEFKYLIEEFRNKFLEKTTPDLTHLVRILNEVLQLFFMTELPPVVGELAWEVVRESRLAEAKLSGGSKLSASEFPRFRKAFERHFLQRLVSFTAEEMLSRVRQMEDKFRRETIRFVSDPQIFSDVCELICDSVYDFLYCDGFLDFPSDWRDRIAKG